MEFSKYALKLGDPSFFPERRYIWPEGVPGAEKASKAPEEVLSRSDVYYHRNIFHITKPAIFPFLAPQETATGRAVLVCPGGGYLHSSIDHEGFELARYFNAMGISAFVLNYRDPAADDKMGVFPEGPLSDALRAMRLIRASAKEYRINPNDLGIMGFSSGGHLCCTASTLYDTLADPDPKLNQISARPDFSIPIYPVVTFLQDFQHRGSVLRLLGGESTMAQLIRFSLERQVTSKTPPTFLVHAEDDSVVPCFNSIAYYQALVRAGVSAELHVFPKGGHGYGMRTLDETIDIWPILLKNWLKHLPNPQKPV